MKERREKRLCYFCDEKWNPSHHCRKAKIYLMEGMDLFDNSEYEVEELTQEVLVNGDCGHKDEETPEISLHAIAGALSPRTMRLSGLAHGCSVVILVDTGSTHNFLDPLIAKKAGLKIGNDQLIEVRVANGDRMSSEGMEEGLDLKVQGNQFVTDFFLLPLGGCDVVLGMQWLRTLGPVLWDFNSLTMSFKDGNKLVNLKGLNPSGSEIVQDVQICQLTTVERNGISCRLCKNKYDESVEGIDQKVETVLQ